MAKFTILVPGLAQGGAERIACELASQFADNNHDVALATLFTGSPVFEVSPKLAIHKLRYQQRFHFKGAGLIENLLTMKAIRRYVLSHGVERLMVFTHRLACLALLATKGTAVEVYCGEVSNPLIERHGRMWQRLTRYCYARFDEVVLQTNTIKKALVDWRPQGYQVIGNSTAIATSGVQATAQENTKKLVFIGRLTPEKGLQDTLQALALIPEEKRWPFDIYGSGENQQQLSELIVTLGLESSVTMQGPTNKVKEKLQQASVFVMSSYREGFPVALLEAQAMGLPVVSYKTLFGPEDIIEHEATGLLVPLKDVKALSEALMRVFEMPDNELQAWGEQAAYLANKRYHPDIIYGKWESLLFKGITK
ncbi:glycosyltransferase [Agarivorans aestuarii]|uniref:glycosyltransferase n=1 Tax=Agarivorans aestuarii TaxID=1563703 RepID=UPI001C7FE511|nr:glycosyltransferase [Agarivorans aestuarii]